MCWWGRAKSQIYSRGKELDQNNQFLLASEIMLPCGLGKSTAWPQEFLFPSCNFHRFACSILEKAAKTCKHIPSKEWWFIVKHHPNSTSKFVTLFLHPYLPIIHGFIWFPYVFPFISSYQNTPFNRRELSTSSAPFNSEGLKSVRAWSGNVQRKKSSGTCFFVAKGGTSKQHAKHGVHVSFEKT